MPTMGGRVLAALGAGVALMLATAPAVAGPTVKKKAWTTHAAVHTVLPLPGWSHPRGSLRLPNFTCPAGEHFRLVSMQVSPFNATVARRTGMPGLADLGPWKVAIALGGVDSDDGPRVGAFTVASENAHSAEARVDGGIALVPLAPGFPIVVAVELANPGPIQAEFTVFLTGACGTAGDVGLEPVWRGQ